MKKLLNFMGIIAWCVSLSPSAREVLGQNVIPTCPLDLALGSNGWNWSNESYQGSWFCEPNETFEGRPTAKSGSQTRLAMLHSDVNGPGTLTFAWRIQAETLSDSLRFWYGLGNEISCDPTTSEWQQQTVYLGNGGDSLWWLHNNYSTSSLAGAWLAAVKLIPGGTAPLIAEQPRDSSWLEGSPAWFRVKAVGTPALKYQWRHQGQPVADGTQSVLKLRRLKSSDAGAYDVVVSNDYGTTISQTAELKVEPAPSTPELVFTYVPPWGSSELLEGMVYNLDPNGYIVAVYIEVYGTWWTKPYWDPPCTKIKDDGTWTCKIVTGGGDEYATTIAAFVLPKPCDPPLGSGQAEIPAEVVKNAVASQIVNRSLPSIQFSGRKWFVKVGQWGPGDNCTNYFSHSPQNVSVDEEGRLHLKIRRNQGIWKCSEVILADSLGYGTYRFYVDSRVDNPPDNVVVGLFTWSNNPSYNHREIDIEFSRWNDGPDAPDGQFVVQPHQAEGHRIRFPMRPNLAQTVHELTWEPGQIRFRSLGGGDPNTKENSDVIREYTFDHPREVPPPGDETARINLWLFKCKPPGDGKEFELVVKKFEYLPFFDFTKYAMFSDNWLSKDCSEPTWCERSDLDHNGRVDFVDFALFAKHWLQIVQ